MSIIRVIQFSGLRLFKHLIRMYKSLESLAFRDPQIKNSIGGDKA